MDSRRTLLVVADEKDPLGRGYLALLQACGAEIRTVCRTEEALRLVASADVAGILLRTSRVKQDRDRCLRILAQKKPETPTILWADSRGGGLALSMASPGISQCLTEPVSPEEMAQALWRLIRRRNTVSGSLASGDPLFASKQGIRGDKYCFRNESWFQMSHTGLAVIGVFPPVHPLGTFRSVSLPSTGEIVYQGLPLASIQAEGMAPRLVASPLTGVIVDVNAELDCRPEALLEASCDESWLAWIFPTRLAEELPHCGLRHVVLVNSNPVSAAAQRVALMKLGCEVKVVSGWAEAIQVLWERDSTIIVIDAASVAENGPEIAARLRSAAPEVRIVVVASVGAQREAAYRRLGVFYYAIEPFADGEISDILGATFRPTVETLETCDWKPESYRGIRIANREGREVRLLTSGGLLQQGNALGAWICRKLRQRLIPYEMISGQGGLTPAVIRDEANRCDRLVVLAARDTGRLPGSLVRDSRGELVTVPPELAGKVIGLVVQPDPAGGAVGRTEVLTAASLAEHVVVEMLLERPRLSRSGKTPSARRRRRGTAAAKRSRGLSSQVSGVTT
ncbi:MAG TPA: hypothetical protein PLL20_04465 [Phycisphaerae bacterium]|nr:hypothetical protein [Phycisphaerae bacterium]HRR83873.1 hypothetical protein [Phycisphaerae bacterium]